MQCISNAIYELNLPHSFNLSISCKRPCNLQKTYNKIYQHMYVPCACIDMSLSFWIQCVHCLFWMCKCFFNLTGGWTRLIHIHCVVKVSKLNECCPFGNCMRADNNWVAIRFSFSEYWNHFFRYFIALTGWNGEHWFHGKPGECELGCTYTE